MFHRDGKPLGRFDKHWRATTQKAGLEGKLFYDLRRTAITNMVRSGTPVPVVMQTSGHRTDAVFRRYGIFDTEDFGRAQERLQEYLSTEERRGVRPIRPERPRKTAS